MFLVVFQPLAAVRDRGDVAGGNPPETITGLIHLFEPLGAVAKYLGVIRLVSEIAQRLDRFPDRHIDDHERIVVVGDVGGVARFRLEPPDKAGSLVGKSVDGLELRDEFGDLRIIQRSEETRYVDLGEIVAHSGFLVIRYKRRFRN